MTHVFYSAMSIIISLAALIGYLNNRFFRMPTTVAINMGSLIITLFLLLLVKFGWHSLPNHARHLLELIDFHDLLIEGMLSFLLFAGALNIKISFLRQCKWEIGVLALLGTVLSTIIVGFSVYYLFDFLNHPIPLIYALLFGALISPTDPIAVLAIFKELNAPKKLEVTVAGESLFNDGVGIVIFLTLFQFLMTGQAADSSHIGYLFLRMAMGGIGFGAVLGFLGCYLLKPITDQKVAILITVAIASGGYAFSEWIAVSGPLAMVVAGLIIGNKHKLLPSAPFIRGSINEFWEMVDEILNAILFFLIGFELLTLDIHWKQFWLAGLAIPLVLITRLFVVWGCITPFRLRKRTYDKYFVPVLTWGGLRGGLAIALALALPNNAHQDLVITMTYAVVIFSILIQGLTIKPLVKACKT